MSPGQCDPASNSVLPQAPHLSSIADFKMHHYLISLSHPELFSETVRLSTSDEKAVSTGLDVQTPQESLDHTSPSRLDALVVRIS